MFDIKKAKELNLAKITLNNSLSHFLIKISDTQMTAKNCLFENSIASFNVLESSLLTLSNSTFKHFIGTSIYSDNSSVVYIKGDCDFDDVIIPHADDILFQKEKKSTTLFSMVSILFELEYKRRIIIHHSFTSSYMIGKKLFSCTFKKIQPLSSFLFSLV